MNSKFNLVGCRKNEKLRGVATAELGSTSFSTVGTELLERY
jgi:hypothetical protein